MMSSSLDNVIRQTNQTAAFFAPYPHDEAVAAVADHLHKFWDPQSRRTMFVYLEQGGAGLSELARAGVQKLKEQLAG